MQRITKERSGYHIIWPLAEALKWRCGEFNCSIDDAFGELSQLCGGGRIAAVGIFAGSHPTRPMTWPKHDIWQDPPTSHPSNTPGLGVIDAKEWVDLLYVLDENQRPTSSLKYASARLPAWKGVEFDRDPLVNLWQAVKGAPPSRTRIRNTGEMARFVDVLPAEHLDRSLESLFARFKLWYNKERQKNAAIKPLPQDERKLKDKFSGLIQERKADLAKRSVSAQ
jgi:hypothetical protein